MKLLLTLLLMLIFTLPAWGEYVFQITTERDAESKCINWRDITPYVTFELDSDSTHKVFTEHPDESAIDADDLQEWYVDAEADGFYLVSFSFTGVGLIISGGAKYRQYWFRYSFDGILFSEAQAVVVMKPGKPVKK